MNYSVLLEEALEERGNAVLVIARPADGEDAIIQTTNGCFAHMVGRQAHLLTGLRLGALQSVVEHPADWTALMTATRTLAPLQLDIRLRVCDRESWLGFGLTFKTDARASYGILIGRDITQARRRSMKETESQRLLAAVFMRTSAPVLIVRANGMILMANSAFQHLVGYTQQEIATLNVDALTPADHDAEIKAARARQLRDGGTYEIAFDTLTKTGVRVPVLLTSVLLRDVQDLRVVTVLPITARPQRGLSVESLPARSIGQVQAISLAAFKTAFGDAWERLAPRAMMLAEQIIKRRLAGADVFNRSDDHGFIIWFDSLNEDRNATVLARAAREIRLRFLTEFGEAAAASLGSHVTAAVVTTTGDAGSPDAMPPALIESLHGKRHEAACRTQLLLQDLRGAGADVQAVTDRTGKARPLVVVDFAPALRRRLDDPAASFGEPESSEIDLLRADLAVMELGRCAGAVLLPIAWTTLCQAGPRRLLDQRLERCGPTLAARLMLAVSGVPASAAKRWAELAGSLRQLGDIGLVVTLEDDDDTDQQTVVGGWPLRLLVIDAGASPDRYYGVTAAARHRGVPVLVRLAAADHTRDWHELGATMFCGPADTET